MMHTDKISVAPSGLLAKVSLPVMGFVAIGAFSFGLACVVLLLRPDALSGEPVRGLVMALTHLVSLGWIASVLFAGAYLFGPLLAGSPLWSNRLPFVHLFCHVAGLALLLGGLATQRYEVASLGTGILCIGLLVLVLNLVVTGSKRSLWTPSNLAFQASMFWLAMTGGVALFMLRQRLTEQSNIVPEALIALHAHYALFGFLAQALLAVSLRVVPELLGIDKMPRWMNGVSRAGWVLLNASLFLLPMAQWYSRAAILTIGVGIALGIAGFVVQIAGSVLLHRARLSWGALTHVTGVLLLLLIVGGALWNLPQAGEGYIEALRSWVRLYIALSLLGPFVFAILGTGERLIPRLIWQLRFAPWAKYAQLPPSSTLARESAGGPVFFSLLMAWVYLYIGQTQVLPGAIRLAAVLLLMALVWFVVVVAPALLRLVIGVTPEDLRELKLPVVNSEQGPVQKTPAQKHEELSDEIHS